MLRRTPRWFAVLLVFVATSISSLAILWWNGETGLTLASLVQKIKQATVEDWVDGIIPAAESFYCQGIGVMLLASLIAGIRCSGTISNERERQTWEALLLTPLTERQLVRGKLWGILGASHVYLITYAVPALLFLCSGDQAAFWILLWLGVTWLAMRFVGSAGIWCSGRSKSSWRSLLGTLAIGYVGGVLAYMVASIVAVLLAGVLWFFISIFDGISDKTTGSGGPF